ncbi:MAG: YraN family protein [Gemmatimonadota bacterium]
MQAHELGRRSEELACDYLRARGWAVLERNYRAGHKEIDIIARLERTIAFIEVKARSGSTYGHALEAITWTKRNELAHAARAWLQRNARAGHEYRFDAIAITWRGARHRLEHVENAWRVR